MHHGRDHAFQAAPLAWRTLVFLATVALLLRALIPAGYMPEHAADPARRIMLTLCTGAGPAASAALALPGESAGPDSDEIADAADCVYGAFASQAATPQSPAGTPAALPAATVATTHLARQILPPPPPPGPPLGSRAPPSRLA